MFTGRQRVDVHHSVGAYQRLTSKRG